MRWLLGPAIVICVALVLTVVLAAMVIGGAWLSDQPHAFDSKRARRLEASAVTELIPGPGIAAGPSMAVTTIVTEALSIP
jgi:hypothetical protein